MSLLATSRSTYERALGKIRESNMAFAISTGKLTSFLLSIFLDHSIASVAELSLTFKHERMSVAI